MKKTSRLFKPLLLGGMVLAAINTQARHDDIGTSALPVSGVLHNQQMPAPRVIERIKNRSQSSNLYFLENKGQVTDQYLQSRSDIGFKVAAPGLNVFIGNGQIHYQFSKKIATDAKEKSTFNTYRMDVALVGANTTGKVITEEQQGYYENHILPKAGDNTVTAHAFKKITYTDVYPNIDWVLYIKQGQLEYDFVVHPGGNPADIQIQYAGATKLKVNGTGSLTAVTPMGTITEQTPYSYDNNGRVASRFILKGDVLSFATAKHKGTLVIDPALIWATYYGGTSEDYSRALSCDGLGNVYMSGESQSATNIATTGSFQASLSGFVNAFAAKFDSTGVRKWATYYGSGGDTYGYAIHYDGFGCVYLAGQTNSPLYLSTNTAFQTVNGGGTCDGYLIKFDTLGARRWATYFGNIGEDIARGVTTDKYGNVFLTGQTASNAAMTSTGSHQEIYGGGSFDAFLVKFDSTGVRRWATYYGGSSDDYGYSSSCDQWGNIYMTGYTLSANAMATPNSSQPAISSGGDFETFLVRFDSGGVRKWGTYYGGTAMEMGMFVACDPAGNAYITGRTNSTTNISTANGHQPTVGSSPKGAASTDAYLAKFDTAGTRIWGTYYGGSGTEYGWAVSCDGMGNVFLAGETNSAAAIATQGSHQETLGGGLDGFVAEFDTAGVRQWATYHGGTGDDYGFAVSADNFGSIFLAGQTNSDANIATPGSLQTTIGSTVGSGGFDGYLVRYWECPMLIQPTTITGKDTVCEGDAQTYSIPAVAGATTYNWTIPTGWTGSSTTNSITVTAGSNGGAISVSAENGCGNVAQSLTVNVYAFPPAQISVNGFTLGTSAQYATYQWYLDGVAIPGGTNSTYTVVKNGTYSVKVTNGLGCSDSTSYPITNVGVSSVAQLQNDIKIYPNPATDIVHIQSAQPNTVTISSIDGKVLLQHRNVIAVNISSLSPGIYMIRVMDANGTLLKTEKLIKAVQ